MNQTTLKNYCIGLDIGTNSVGYAMTDMEGRLLKHQKRSTFGVVLFEEAQSAKERRTSRSTRRRLDRREHRIDILQTLLQEELCKKDELFLIRLNESFLQNDERRYPLLYGTLPTSIWEEDITTKSKETSRKAFPYPSIYHLRHALIHAEKQADIRYIYLALHHIIKYRGHFLLEGQDLNEQSTSIPEEIKNALNILISDPFYYQLQNDETVIANIQVALLQHNISKSKKAELIIASLQPKGKSSKDAAKAFANFVVGLEGSLKTLCGYEGDNPTEKFSFGQEELDLESYAEVLGNNSELVEKLYNIYHWQLFSGICETGDTISDAMIRRYEKHQRDLRQFKAWVRTYAPKQYNSMFRDIKAGNYCDYSGHYDQKLLSGKALKRCDQKTFYDNVKKLLTSVKTPEAQHDAEPMLNAISVDNGFLPLLRINLNGAIPNQMHAQELSKILDNQGRYYPCLLKNKEKIMSLCTFRLPYYVGPLNSASPFAKWIKRDTTRCAYPWNWSEVVDRLGTAEGFIQNLTNKCTYLPGKDVLPLHSLLYEEYELLDELNRVTINGKLIENGLKQRIIDGLFKRQKNVTLKSLEKWLRENSCYADEPTINIEHLHGADGFASSLRSYIDFTQKCGLEITPETTPMIETIIRWSTIFENRGILREKIEQQFPQLDKKQVDYICRRRYSGWGRLSEELLNSIQGTLEYEPATIIEIMRRTNDNFMRVIHNKRYGFDKIIEAAQQGKVEGPIQQDEVMSMQGSPALKRGIWQAVRIVNELIHVQRHLPEAIYIENTRSEDENRRGKRTIDRIAQIESLYKSIDDTSDNFKVCQQQLKDCKALDKTRLDDRQFLYFLQLGRCLYTGKVLDFNNLSQYQIDHILPQSYIKDDSIDNRALVYASENQRKKDSLLLSADIQEHMKGWWLYLRKVSVHGLNLMSDKKFHNLTRTAVSEYEQLGFINRQLVETSQIIKHVVTLFRTHYPETRVEGINARLSSNVRDTYQLYKIRELNDTHHAYDAFLACTIGTFIDRYLSWIADESVAASMAREFWKKSQERKNLDMGRDMHIRENGIILNYFSHDQIDEETGEILRNASQHIGYLKAVLCYRDHFVVRRKNIYRGAFFDQTRYPAGKKDAHYFPLKKGLPVERYGGYSSIKPAYIAAISFQKGKRIIGKLVNVPVVLLSEYEKDSSVLIRYLQSTDQDFKDCSNMQIIRSRILLNQKIFYEGSEMLLKSCSEAWNGKQLYLSFEDQKLLYQLTHYAPASWNCTEEQLDTLYETLMEKMKMQYPVYFSTIGTRLNKASDKIKALPLVAKGTFILETLKIMQVSGNFAMYKSKLPTIELSDNQGRITNKAFDIAKLCLIDQSITGFYERRTPLWVSEQS